jgi:hypothetical protein
VPLSQFLFHPVGELVGQIPPGQGREVGLPVIDGPNVGRAGSFVGVGGTGVLLGTHTQSPVLFFLHDSLVLQLPSQPPCVLTEQAIR